MAGTLVEKMQSIPLGVVIERREIDNPWQSHVWVPVAVIPGAPAPEGWREIARGESWVRYHVATLTMELHRKETEAYRANLSSARPAIFVMLAETDDEDAAHEVEASRVTASPYDAQDYLDSGEIIVEGVAMPDGVIAFVQAFVDRHHVDEPFVKRKRRPHNSGDDDHARRPFVSEARRGRGEDHG